LTNIPDKLRRVTELKVNFENYEKIPQPNMVNYYQALNYFNATPLIGDPFYSEQSFNSFMINMGFRQYNYIVPIYDPLGYGFRGTFEFENIVFVPPNLNQNNEFYVRKKPIINNSSAFEFSVIKKNIIEIDPPEIASYTALPGRSYLRFWCSR